MLLLCISWRNWSNCDGCWTVAVGSGSGTWLTPQLPCGISEPKLVSFSPRGSSNRCLLGRHDLSILQPCGLFQPTYRRSYVRCRCFSLGHGSYRTLGKSPRLRFICWIGLGSVGECWCRYLADQSCGNLFGTKCSIENFPQSFLFILKPSWVLV